MRIIIAWVPAKTDDILAARQKDIPILYDNHSHRLFCLCRFAALAISLCVIGLPRAHAQTPLEPSAPPPPKIGKIGHITVSGNAHIPTAAILAQLKKSNVATSEDLNAALQGMGVFQSIEVKTTVLPAGGTDVTCTVVENPVVRAIKFTANTPDGQPSVPAATLIGQMHTAVGQVLNSKTLISDLDHLFNHDTGYMRAQGYIGDVTESNIDFQTGVVAISLAETFIDKIEIQGNGPVSAAEILEALRMKPGDLFNFNAAQQGLLRIDGTNQFGDGGQINFTSNEPGKMSMTVTLRLPRGPIGTPAASSVSETSFSYGGTVGGAVVIPVQINEHAIGHFMLVTNTDLSEISSAFAASLGLKPQPMLVGSRPYYIDGQPASSVAVDRMALGGMILGGTSGIDIGHVSLPITDLSSLSQPLGQTIDGILGADVLSQIAIAIDFPRRRVTLWSHGNLSPIARSSAGFGGAAAVPLSPVSDTLPMLTVNAKLRDETVTQTTSLRISTGNLTSLLPTASAKVLGMTPLSNPDDPTMVLSRTSHLDFGGLSLNDPLFQVTDTDNGATLGVNVLSRYRMLLDSPARTAYFAPEVIVTGSDPHRMPLAVPFHFDHLLISLPVVQVSINGHPPLPFLFDTGTSVPLAIDHQAAQGLGLTIDPLPAGTINGSVPVETASVSTAVLQGRTPADNVTASLEQAWVIDLGVLHDAFIGKRIAGIIGAGMLRDTAVHFDFSSRTLTFFPHRADVPMPPGTLTRPMRERTGDENYFATFTPASGPPMQMLVDTGNESTTVPYDAIVPYAMRVAGPSLPSAVAAHWMLGSMALGQNLMLSQLTFVGIPMGKVIVSTYFTDDAHGTLTLPNLGIDVLSRLSVTFDIPRMRLMLSPPARPIPPVYSGWAGLRLAQTGNVFSITQVLPNSPAVHAGLKKDDVLLAVDGIPLSGLILSNARDLANGLAGMSAKFLIRRGGAQPRIVRFRRASVSGDPPSPLNGVYGLREAANPFVVQAVVPGCPAARAGLTAGDTITAINGLATPKLSVGQWGTLLLDTRLTLTVTHAGVSHTVVLANAPQKRTPPPSQPSQHSPMAKLRPPRRQAKF